MKKIRKIIGFCLGGIISILILATLVVIINHKIHLGKEDVLVKPMGQMVSVDGHNMSVYTEGQGNTTLVFLAGGGTASPILDFKSLYSRLSDKYKIAVPERIGYGFSDVADVPRDLDTVLEEDRQALLLAGLKPPYVLVPHSITGLESVYWAQKYPKEVSAIVGIDVGTVNAYFDPSTPKASDFIAKIKILAFAEKMGVTRFIPSMVESEAAIKAGNLTAHEKDIYRAIYYRRTNTPPMVEELVDLMDNAHKVDALPPPQLPVLFFISNGDGIGLGYSKEQWQGFQISYLSKIANSKYVLMDYGHYLQDFAPDVLAQKIKDFVPAT
ncbi:alpha/beta hydrolase [Paenibacillus lupini]|uniref:alpha/beta fold hydrolase n=1 Tax=Paenibacillus lupini TaxID=1450204 RepID=UPI001421295C|nr:alpha/beta hydrolase [Paenibacillus lupini]NIK21523.1 pimeloyl-ACP methyl ester carboxylesterase [Paenibacillus lupini]